MSNHQDDTGSTTKLYRIGLIVFSALCIPSMGDQCSHDLPVMRLPGGQAEPEREPLRIDDDMNLRREPAARSTETMIWPRFFLGRSLLVRADGSAVDHLDLTVMCGAEGAHQPVPDPGTPPSHETIVAGGAGTAAIRQVPPRRTDLKGTT